MGDMDGALDPTADRQNPYPGQARQHWQALDAESGDLVWTDYATARAQHPGGHWRAESKLGDPDLCFYLISAD